MKTWYLWAQSGAVLYGVAPIISDHVTEQGKMAKTQLSTYVFIGRMMVFCLAYLWRGTTETADIPVKFFLFAILSGIMSEIAARFLVASRYVGGLRADVEVVNATHTLISILLAMWLNGTAITPKKLIGLIASVVAVLCC